MKEEILNEITNNCEYCHFSNKCLEEDCALWRIEQIVINDDKDD